MFCLLGVSRKQNVGLCWSHRRHNLDFMTTGQDWQAQVGRSWADMYVQTDRSFAGLTQHLLERISGQPGNSVLDVGCGAGELAIAVSRARPRGQVLGIDLSADLIAVAEERARHHANVRFAVCDAATWTDSTIKPDLLISRHGVMFFAEPIAAFRHLREAAAPAARMVFSCFRSARENRWASDLAEQLGLPAPADPFAPGPFAFADPQYVEPLLLQAGWRDIDFEPFDYAYIAGQGEAPVADAMRFLSRIGPAAAALRALDADAREGALQRLEQWLTAHRSGDLVVFGGAAWIVTAQAG